jgi:hypothetical protein
VFIRFTVFATVVLIGLNICKLIEIEIDCVVCGKPTYRENVLCRFASRFNTNFMHDYCAKDLKFYWDGIDDGVSSRSGD